MMLLRLFSILEIVTYASATQPSSSSFPLSCAGIWDRSASVSRADYHLVRGVQGSGRWSDIERENGTFDWSSIDGVLSKAAEGEGCFYTQIQVGPDSPDWLYDAGVPKVTTSGGKAKFPHYPYYLSDNYKKYYFRMINSLGDFLKNHKFASKVAFVEMDTGCTGDNVPYKGTPPKQYAISSQEWADFAVAAAAEYKKVFQSGSGRSIPLMSNGDAMDAWSIKNIDAVGIKGSAFVRFHHLSGERSWVERYQKNMLNVPVGQKFIITRAEMDQTFKMMPAFAINEALGFYWGTLTGLNQGLLVHDFSEDGFNAVKKLPNTAAFDLYNKYASQVSPEYATGAFIALHEGLDANDVDKYPVARFGSPHNKTARAQNICAAYAQYGCRLDDVSVVAKGQVAQRHEQKGYNDVGYDIWPTNYMRWLEQIDADVTSVGLFRIGGPITAVSSIYSRFARGLRHKEHKSGMYFALHANFFKTTPVSTVSIRIVWYDSMTGSWQLEYTTTDGSKSTAWDQKMIGDGQWKEATFKIANAAMRRSHERGSDFAIVSKDSTDAVFHMLEVTRESTEAAVVV